MRVSPPPHWPFHVEPVQKGIDNPTAPSRDYMSRIDGMIFSTYDVIFAEVGPEVMKALGISDTLRVAMNP
jgi:hypothetical protein